jgi:hypothetical protein
MAHKIKGDVQIDGLSGSGTRPVAVDSTGKLIEETATAKTNGTLLGTVDMTNGGADNLQNIDIVWQSSWDDYDYVDLVVADARNGGANSRSAWALASVGTPSTWINFSGSIKDAAGWSITSVPQNITWHGVARMWIQSSLKRTACNSMMYNVDSSSIYPSIGSYTQATVFNYSGTTLTSGASPTGWFGWDTGSKGLDGYILRLVQDGGTLNNGTIKIVGYKYP